MEVIKGNIVDKKVLIKVMEGIEIDSLCGSFYFFKVYNLI